LRLCGNEKDVALLLPLLLLLRLLRLLRLLLALLRLLRLLLALLLLLLLLLPPLPPLPLLHLLAPLVAFTGAGDSCGFRAGNLLLAGGRVVSAGTGTSCGCCGCCGPPPDGPAAVAVVGGDMPGTLSNTLRKLGKEKTL
jgi:hypothetical protein